MTTFNLGTIKINNPKVEMLIKTSSVDEIKNMFVAFLESEFIAKNQPKKQKGKWGKFAQRMSGLTTPEITEHITKTSQEMRDGFEFRDLKTLQD